MLLSISLAAVFSCHKAKNNSLKDNSLNERESQDSSSEEEKLIPEVNEVESLQSKMPLQENIVAKPSAENIKDKANGIPLTGTKEQKVITAPASEGYVALNEDLGGKFEGYCINKENGQKKAFLLDRAVDFGLSDLNVDLEPANIALIVGLLQDDGKIKNSLTEVWQKKVLTLLGRWAALDPIRAEKALLFFYTIISELSSRSVYDLDISGQEFGSISSNEKDDKCFNMSIAKYVKKGGFLDAALVINEEYFALLNDDDKAVLIFREIINYVFQSTNISHSFLSRKLSLGMAADEFKKNVANQLTSAPHEGFMLYLNILDDAKLSLPIKTLWGEAELFDFRALPSLNSEVEASFSIKPENINIEERLKYLKFDAFSRVIFQYTPYSTAVAKTPTLYKEVNIDNFPVRISVPYAEPNLICRVNGKALALTVDLENRLQNLIAPMGLKLICGGDLGKETINFVRFYASGELQSLAKLWTPDQLKGLENEAKASLFKKDDLLFQELFFEDSTDNHLIFVRVKDSGLIGTQSPLYLKTEDLDSGKIYRRSITNALYKSNRADSDQAPADMFALDPSGSLINSSLRTRELAPYYETVLVSASFLKESLSEEKLTQPLDLNERIYNGFTININEGFRTLTLIDYIGLRQKPICLSYDNPGFLDVLGNQICLKAVQNPEINDSFSPVLPEFSEVAIPIEYRINKSLLESIDDFTVEASVIELNFNTLNNEQANVLNPLSNNDYTQIIDAEWYWQDHSYLNSQNFILIANKATSNSGKSGTTEDDKVFSDNLFYRDYYSSELGKNRYFKILIRLGIKLPSGEVITSYATLGKDKIEDMIRVIGQMDMQRFLQDTLNHHASEQLAK